MINELLKKDSYIDLTSKQVKELIVYLKRNDLEFNITANLSAIEFNPKLPNEIYSSMSRFTLFSLANYTFTSLNIHEKYLEFEAGFGSQNFGSICTISFDAIFQIGIDESILFINPVATIKNTYSKKKIESDDEQKRRSMNAFNIK